MEIIHLDETNLNYWQNHARENVVALGFFDGMHKGHQHVIESAKTVAKKKDISLDVMSFFPHPKTVLSNGKTIVQYLMSLDEKAEVLAEMGVDRFYIVDFTKSFASLKPDHYVKKYLLDFKTVHVVAGFDFTYGFKGQGNINRLNADSNYQITTSRIEEIDYQGKKISSTLIREAIQNGRISEVKQLMGRRFTSHARVANGNFYHKPNFILPQSGLYDAIIEAGHRDYKTKLYVDGNTKQISFVDNTLIKPCNNRNVKITWLRKVASFAFYQHAIS